MKRALPLVLSLAAEAAFANDPSTASKPLAFDIRVEPDKIHEECLRLEAGQSRRYEWTASAPVLEFNIHYHRDADVFYPVKREAIARDRGTFRAPSGEDYCWMWTAKGAVSVKGRIY